MRFVDLFAGMGGFHLALNSLGHECVFASEIDDELRELYKKNFPKSQRIVYGNIRECKDKVPKHDILCAGFPCQPFSKSGYQNGRRDRTRGTLFHEIIEILKLHRPPFVILENVGNFERHNEGRTWKVVRDSLTELPNDLRILRVYSVHSTGERRAQQMGDICKRYIGRVSLPDDRESCLLFQVRLLENGLQWVRSVKSYVSGTTVPQE